jgi:hypothetical protein
MKSISAIIIGFFALGLSIPGCTGTNAVEPILFQIVVASQFSADSVRVEIDGATWLSRSMTTDSTDGLAWVSDAIPFSNGFHTLSVKVLSSATGIERNFEIAGDMHVTVYYQPDTKALTVVYNSGILRRSPIL